MRRKMVISSIAVYAIALSCITLFVGKTLGSTAVNATATATKRTNRPLFGEEKTGPERTGERNPRTMQGWHLPSNVTGQQHSYFAYFDTVRGKTEKVEVGSANGTPDSVPREQLEFFTEKRTKERSSAPRRLPNFVSRDTLKDSEIEVRVHLNGVTAKETMISAGVDQETGKRQGLKLRQLTDGKNFIQLIYNLDDEIQDCEFLHQKDFVDKFLSEFQSDMQKAKIAYEIEVEGNELTSGHHSGEMKPEDEEYFEEDEGGIENYSVARGEDLWEKEEELEDTDSQYQIRNVTFQIIERDQDFPQDIASWLNYPMLKRSCRRTHKILKKLVHHTRSSDLETKKSAQDKLERKKRDLMDVFRMPGTKWCGKGKRASKYTSLGAFSRTDKCCRIHDTMCPYWIGGFEEKYGLFNWKLGTIMHCRCDKRFRSCLKMARTGAANLVGKLFFNIVQTQCFVLKPEEVCVKQSWWGKCEKKEYKKKAYLRDNIPY